MEAHEVLTNLHTTDVARAREFYGVLGLTDETMNQGWVARFTSPTTGASVQVVTKDATAVEDSQLTIKVDDVDAALRLCTQRGYEIVHPLSDEAWGIRRFFVRSPDGQVVNVAQHRPHGQDGPAVAASAGAGAGAGRRVVVFGASGKTGRAVVSALQHEGAEVLALGRDWAAHLTACDAAYLIAPNLHDDEPALVSQWLEALRANGTGRVVYHSVASPFIEAMPHHVGKARSEELVRRAGLGWTILQPAPYVENLDLTGTVRVPYRTDAVFGLLRLSDLGEAAARVLLEDGHEGATYELASLQATTEALAASAGQAAVRVDFAAPAGMHPREARWLQAMFDYYDRYGLPVGTRPLSCLLGHRTVA